MNNKRAYLRPKWFWYLANWIIFFFISTGCSPILLSVQLDPLPTFAPVAVLVEAEIEANPTAVSVPPTFTPVGIPNQTPLTLPGISIEPVPDNAPLATQPPATPVPTSQILPTGTPPPQNKVSEPAPVTSACTQNGRLFQSHFPSEFGGPTRDYHIYLPPCYGEDGRVYPVLYLFHGSVQNDTHWVDLGLISVLNDNMLNGNYPPFIVIMPDNGVLGNITSGDERSIEGITLNALLPYIEENFCTWNDRRGRSIGGISRGGYWALMIAFRHDHLFGSVSAHSSHLRLETDKAEYNPLSTYATANLTQLRIWMDWGEDDFLRLGQQQLTLLLQNADANLDSHINPGGHNEQYWQSHLPEYIDWHAATWSTNRQDYLPCPHQ